MLQKCGDHHLLDVQNPVNNGMNDQPQLVSWISSINSLMDDHYGLFHKPLSGSLLNNKDFMKSIRGSSFVAQLICIFLGCKIRLLKPVGPPTEIPSRFPTCGTPQVPSKLQNFCVTYPP